MVPHPAELASDTRSARFVSLNCSITECGVHMTGGRIELQRAREVRHLSKLRCIEVRQYHTECETGTCRQVKPSYYQNAPLPAAHWPPPGTSGRRQTPTGRRWLVPASAGRRRPTAAHLPAAIASSRPPATHGWGGGMVMHGMV